MNTRNGLLGVFVILTLIFASLALVEHGQVTTSTATTTLVSTATTTTTSTTTVSPLTAITTVTTYLPPVTSTQTQTTTLPPVTSTQTQTSTVTSTLPPTTTTATATATITLTSTSGASQLYGLEFVQQARCPYGGWLYPWGVALNDQTVVQPSNETLGETEVNSNNGNYSALSFAVPDGTYSYTVLPKEFFAQSGNVTVDGSAVVIKVYQALEAMGCSSTSTSTTTTTTTTTTITAVASKNTISLSGFSIVTSGVVQPTPYLSGSIYVDAGTGVTWSSYALYTNNSYCGTRDFNTPTTMNQFTYWFQGMPCGTVTAGSTYLITFVVTFTDGTNATASVSVLAS